MNDSVEYQIFEWQACDKIGSAAWLFKDCIILQPFGPFKKNEHVAWIELDYDQSRIVCENEAEERIFEGRLVLGVE